MLVIPANKVEVFSEYSIIKVQDREYPTLRPKCTTFYNGHRNKFSNLPYDPTSDICYLSDDIIEPLFTGVIYYLEHRITQDSIFQAFAINAESNVLHRQIYLVLMKINLNIQLQKDPDKHVKFIKELICAINSYYCVPITFRHVSNIYDFGHSVQISWNDHARDDETLSNYSTDSHMGDWNGEFVSSATDFIRNGCTWTYQKISNILCHRRRAAAAARVHIEN